MSSLSPSEQAQLASLPVCIQPIVLQGILNSNCGEDFACLCKSPKFLYYTAKNSLRSCSVADQNAFQMLGEQLCGEANPSLRDTRGPEIISIVAVMMVISTLAVVFRFTARFISAAPYGADDNLIIAALILTYGLNISEIVAVHYGLGEHQLMLNLDHIMRFLQSDWITQVVFGCSITLTRLSLLFFYRRIFATKTFHRLSIIMGVFLVAWWISYVATVIFSCRPVNAFWDQAIDGQCFDEKTLAYGLTATELVMNVALVIMPIPWIVRLKLPTEKKFAIGGIFMLGGFVLIACSLRFPFLAEFEYTDASWTIAGSGIWVNIEANVGIASVCLPVMRPLFNAVHLSNLRSSFSSSRSKRRSGTAALESGFSGASRFSSINEKKRKHESDDSLKKGHKQQRSLVQQLEKAGLHDARTDSQRPSSWFNSRQGGAISTTVIAAKSPSTQPKPERTKLKMSSIIISRPPTPPPKDEIYQALQRASQQLPSKGHSSMQLPRKPVPAPLKPTRSSHPQHPLQSAPPMAYSPGPYRQLHSAAGTYNYPARRSPSPTHSSFSRRTPSPTNTMHPTLRRLSSHRLIPASPSPPLTNTPERRLSKIAERLTRESVRQDRAEARLAEARRVVGEQRKRSHSALEAARENSWPENFSLPVTPRAEFSGGSRHHHRVGSQEHRDWRESRGYGVIGIVNATSPMVQHPHYSSDSPVQSVIRSESREGDYFTAKRVGVGKRVRGDSRGRDMEKERVKGKMSGGDGGVQEWGMEVPEGRIAVTRSIELRRWNSR